MYTIGNSLTAAGLLLACTVAANAATITHSAADFTGNLTPSFGALADPVGTFFVASGVDYSFGNVEGVFNDPPFALCGISATGICDLETAVDGQIVETTGGTAGLTSFISVEAGFSPNGTLTLSVFDTMMNLIASTLNGSPLGPNGRTTMTIDRGGVFDIAYFAVSGNDTFGVNTVTIEAPVPATVVPLPAGLPMLLSAFAGLGLLVRRQRRKAIV